MHTFRSGVRPLVPADVPPPPSTPLLAYYIFFHSDAPDVSALIHCVDPLYLGVYLPTHFLNTSRLEDDMKLTSTTFATLALLGLPGVFASPSIVQRQAVDDGSVNTSNDMRLINLALTLEHVMQRMYIEAASNYTDEDFASAGYPASVKDRYAQMQSHEEAHTQILTDAVVTGAGSASVIGACTYKFPSTDVESFLAVSEYVETMAVSTYNGMLEHFEDKSLIALVASIMNTKARHAAYINSIQKMNPWGTAFDYPLSLNMSFNIIGTFIHRGTCPKTNNLVTMLPIGVYDVAVITFLSVPTPSSSVAFTLAYLPGPVPDVLYAAFITGTDTYYSEVTQVGDGSGSGSVVVPEDLRAKGAVYVVLVTSREDGKVGEDVVEKDVYAGPALAMFSFGDEGKDGREEGEHEGGEHEVRLSA